MNPLIKRWARLAAIAAVFLGTGCQNPSPGDVAVSEIRSGRKMHATLTVAPADDPNAVKSAFSGSDHTVANYNLLVFESGVLAGKYYKDSGSPLAFEVMADRSYNYYCVANTGDLTGAFTVGQTPESRMATWQVEAPVAGAAGLPMAWSGTDIRFSKAQMRAGAQLEISLTRLVAQYDIVLDKSALSQFSFTATSLSICGPSSVTPFASSKAASVASRTDYAVPGDLARLNGGLKSTFYPLENRYGTLLPENNDPWLKVPANLSEDDHPTFIELGGVATVDDGSGLEIPLTYRFFLGRDAIRDFDVRRNEVNTVTLSLTDDALGREEASWKVEKGSYADTRSLAFADEGIYVPEGGSVDELIVRTPVNLKYVVGLDPALTAAGVAVAGVTPGEPVDWDVLTFTAPEGIAPMEGIVRIRSIDGKKSDELTLSTGRRLVALRFGLWPNAGTERFHSDTTFLFGGDIYAHVYAVYSDDTREDITSSLAVSDYQFDADLLSCNHGSGSDLGRFRPLKAGDSQIRVTKTLDGVTVTAESNVHVLPYMSGLAFTEGNGNTITMRTGGESHQFTLEATYAGSGKKDVTADAVWSVEDEELLINDGAGKVTSKLKTGTTTVWASYTENGVSLQRRIQVKVIRIPVELRVFPSMVYLPNAGTDERVAYASPIEYAGPNERTFRLTVSYHDGTSADVSYAPGQTVWTDNLPLRYQTGDTWHILGIQSFNSASSPGRMIIYRAYATTLNARIYLGNNANYLHAFHEAEVVTDDAPKRFLTATYTLNDVTLTADVMGTLVNNARPQRITITPNPQEAYAGGHTVQFQATLEYDDGTTEDITDSASWTVDGLATPEGGGRFTTGNETGSTQVHASVTVSGVTVNGDAGLVVNPRVITAVALEVNPGTGWTDAAQDVNLGSQQEWRLKITYENGDTDYVTRGFQLTSSNTSVVTVSGASTTAQAVGQADISADYEGWTAGPLHLKVLNHDYSYALAVEPKNSTLDSDGEKSYHAWFLTLDNGIETDREDVSRDCDWSVSSGLAAYVETSGAFTVRAKGNNSSSVSGMVLVGYEKDGVPYSSYATLVIRAPFVPSLSVNVPSLEWDYDEYGEESGLSISVSGNVSWNAELISGGDHFSLTAASGEGDGSLKVFPVAKNGSDSGLNGRLRIYDTAYGLECFVDLTQLDFNRRKGIGPVYNKLVVTPSEATIDHDGSFAFTATLYIYKDAAMTDLFRSYDVSLWDWSHWTSSDESAAVMHSPQEHGPTHVANPVANGKNTRTGSGFKETTITCYYGPEIPSGMTISDAANLRVKDIPDQTSYRLIVSVEPSSIGCTGRAQASARLQSSSDGGTTWDAGQDVTSATSWSSSNTTAATIASDGVITGCNTGSSAKSARITGTYGGVTPSVSGQADLQVDGVSSFLDVTPGSLTWNWDASGSGEGLTLTLSGNVAWRVSVPEGFSASPTSGNGDGTVTVWPKARNTSTTDDLTGTLRITGTGVTARTVSLTQLHSSGTEPPATYLSFDRSHYDLVRVIGGTVYTVHDFSVTLHGADGSVTDVTGQASYSDQGGVTVNGTAGTLTATAAVSGKTVTASYDGLTATATYSAEDLLIPLALEGSHVEIQGGSSREFLVEVFEVTLESVLTGVRSYEEVIASVEADPSGPIVCEGYTVDRGILFHFTEPGSGSVTFRYVREGVTVSCVLDLTCASDNTITCSWR